MVSLLEVSLVPDRVGGSPLSLKQPKFPGTVGRQEEGENIISYTQQLRCILYHMLTISISCTNITAVFLSFRLLYPDFLKERESLYFMKHIICCVPWTLVCLMASSKLFKFYVIAMFVINTLPHRLASKEQCMVTHSHKYSGLCLNVLVWTANRQANNLASEEKRGGGGGERWWRTRRWREGRGVKGTGMFES